MKRLLIPFFWGALAALFPSGGEKKSPQWLTLHYGYYWYCGVLHWNYGVLLWNCNWWGHSFRSVPVF